MLPSPESSPRALNSRILRLTASLNAVIVQVAVAQTANSVATTYLEIDYIVAARLSAPDIWPSPLRFAQRGRELVGHDA